MAAVQLLKLCQSGDVPFRTCRRFIYKLLPRGLTIISHRDSKRNHGLRRKHQLSDASKPENSEQFERYVALSWSMVRSGAGNENEWGVSSKTAIVKLCPPLSRTHQALDSGSKPCPPRYPAASSPAICSARPREEKTCRLPRCRRTLPSASTSETRICHAIGSSQVLLWSINAQVRAKLPIQGDLAESAALQPHGVAFQAFPVEAEKSQLRPGCLVVMLFVGF
jgi:hypothetical protein